MENLNRRSGDGQPWWQHPAWWSLFLALVLNFAGGVYRAGLLSQKVDDLQVQIQDMHSLLIQLIGKK